jgi:hypothetical protein
VSDLDGVGVCPECRWRKLQELDYIEVRTTEQRDKHIGGDDEKAGTLQSMPTSEREVQGLYKVCTGMDVRGMLQRLYKVYNRDRVIQVIQDLKATDYWRN